MNPEIWLIFVFSTLFVAVVVLLAAYANCRSMVKQETLELKFEVFELFSRVRHLENHVHVGDEAEND